MPSELDTASLNAQWATLLVEGLAAAGAAHAVVCPGSRSTPLALACAHSARLRTWSVVDERSAAFFALGLCKSSQKPVLLVCTSGTAGAHFLPALMEASVAGWPLIALTADRPWELHAWGAPQTVQQEGLFGRFVRFQSNLPVPEAGAGPRRHLVATAVRAATTQGPVHLNVPFREPLTAELPFEQTAALASLAPWLEQPPELARPERRPNSVALARVQQQLEQGLPGVIVCGPRERADGLGPRLHELGRKLGFAVLAEAASQARYVAGAEPITSYDAFLRDAGLAAALRPQVVLRFGGGLTSKLLQSWLDASGAFTVIFSEQEDPVDPGHSARVVVEGDALAACDALLGATLPPPSAQALRYRESLETAERGARRALQRYFQDGETASALTEPRVANELLPGLPPGATLFLSSSMPIRDVDAFAPKAEGALSIFSNRGINGIDGVTSTAAGVSAAASGPVVLLTGDLALLHDLSGLLVARQQRLSMVVVVINNDGGGIFSFLPVAQQKAHFEVLFGTPHGVELAHAAALAGAGHRQPRDVEGFRAALGEALAAGGLWMIEVRTVREENVRLHRAISAAMASAAAAAVELGSEEAR